MNIKFISLVTAGYRQLAVPTNSGAWATVKVVHTKLQTYKLTSLTKIEIHYHPSVMTWHWTHTKLYNTLIFKASKHYPTFNAYDKIHVTKHFD